MNNSTRPALEKTQRLVSNLLLRGRTAAVPEGTSHTHRERTCVAWGSSNTQGHRAVAGDWQMSLDEFEVEQSLARARQRLGDVHDCLGVVLVWCRVLAT